MRNCDGESANESNEISIPSGFSYSKGPSDETRRVVVLVEYLNSFNELPLSATLFTLSRRDALQSSSRLASSKFNLLLLLLAESRSLRAIVAIELQSRCLPFRYLLYFNHESFFKGRLSDVFTKCVQNRVGSKTFSPSLAKLRFKASE